MSINLLNCDCMDYMKKMPDKYFDLAICDPPYNIKTWSATGKYSLSIESIKKLKTWEKEPSEIYFNEIFRVSENQIIWGANHFFDFLGKATTFIVWDKKSRNCYFSDAELAWTSFKKGKVTIFDKYIRENGNKIHPIQKPVKLYKWLLKNYAKTGDKIFDSHLGSGSIAIACHDMDFDLVGCELDKEYYDDAVKRFNIFKSQLKLF